MPDTKARADVEDNFRKTVGQLLGGAAVLLGAGFAYLQFQQQQENFSAQQRNADKQLAASLEQSKQQRESAQALLISNQVSKGFEQLGNEKVEVRLGGIYLLEGVMNTSKDYHQPVLEALCAFVRDHTKANTGDAAPTTDVQAALTVIGRRDAIGGLTPNLSDVRIQKANLIRAKLIRAKLRGANLIDARNLTQEQLNKACSTADTKLDPPLTVKPCP